MSERWQIALEILIGVPVLIFLGLYVFFYVWDKRSGWREEARIESEERAERERKERERQ